jgi:serine/threonine-protein kinase HipA
VSERRADVWHEDRAVGALREASDGRLRFRYAAGWLEQGFPVSLTLPLAGEEVDGHAWFTGLLPEGRALERAAREHRLDERDEVGLLFALGRDCAGALVIVPEGEDPAETEEPLPLPVDDLAALVASRGTAAFPEDRPRRFSLAGAQDKLAVRVEGDAFFLPTRGEPSSHILKFEAIPCVCFAEYLGAAIAERAGLEVALAEYREHAQTPYLRVTRFDRCEGRRLHQEDLTQALGYPSSEKYEQDGGPSLGAVATLVRRELADSTT